ncbi:MAG TPA: hypothetical protein VKB67_11130 [Rhizomicrobium sp.]|nr:hypothetical protein [Rhizomicrobium sp.]
MSSLGDFHHHNEEMEAKRPRIIALIVIALIIGGVALYAVESGMLNSNNTAQTGQSYPRGM